MHRTGFLFVLSSPSGAGKTTLSKMLLAHCRNLTLSISVTTRLPRKREKDGLDYHFVTKTQFEQWKKEDRFLEWAQVFDDYYGTLRQDIEPRLHQGGDTLFDIDWQGFANLKKIMPTQTIGIFILPPTLEHLKQRLTARGDPPHLVEKRMQKAQDEICHAPDYDYIIVNEHLKDSLVRLIHILEAERCHTNRFSTLEHDIERLFK